MSGQKLLKLTIRIPGHQQSTYHGLSHCLITERTIFRYRIVSSKLKTAKHDMNLKESITLKYMPIINRWWFFPLQYPASQPLQPDPTSTVEHIVVPVTVPPGKGTSLKLTDQAVQHTQQHPTNSHLVQNVVDNLHQLYLKHNIVVIDMECTTILHHHLLTHDSGYCTSS